MRGIALKHEFFPFLSGCVQHMFSKLPPCDRPRTETNIGHAGSPHGKQIFLYTDAIKHIANLAGGASLLSLRLRVFC